MTAVWDSFTYPDEALNTVKLEANIQPKDMELPAPIAEGSIGAKIIHVTENHVDTKEKHVPVNVQNGKVVVSTTGISAKLQSWSDINKPETRQSPLSAALDSPALQPLP